MNKKNEWFPENLMCLLNYITPDPWQQVVEFKTRFFCYGKKSLENKFITSEQFEKYYKKAFGEDKLLFEFTYMETFLLRNRFNWDEADLDNLLSIYEIAIVEQTKHYQQEFLLLDPKEFKKRISTSSTSLHAWNEFLLILRKLLFSSEPLIRTHFDSFGFASKQHLVFLNFQDLKTELKAIQKAEIANLDYVGVIDEILAYQIVKTFGELLVWPDTITYTDRLFSKVKAEFDRSFNVPLPKKIDKRLQDFLFDHLYRFNSNGELINILIDNIDKPKNLNNSFFRRRFSNYVKKNNPKDKKRNLYAALYDLFAVVIKNKKFSKPVIRTLYDSDHQYKGLSVERLLYKRSK